MVIYGSAAVTYRLAFTVRDEWREVPGLEGYGSTPILGCARNMLTNDVVSGKLGMFEHLLSPNVNGYSIYAASSEEFGNADLREGEQGNPDWDVVMGWYDGSLCSRRTVNAKGFWDGPLLVGILQPIAEADMPDNKTVQVGEHLKCGRMLQACTADGISCFWLGLGGGNFRVNFTSHPNQKRSTPSSTAHGVPPKVKITVLSQSTAQYTTESSPICSKIQEWDFSTPQPLS